MTRFGTTILIAVLVACSSTAWYASAADAPADEIAWDAVKAYQYGQDLKPLLVVERAAYQSLGDAAQRQGMAQQLLSILSDPQATEAARQFCALQLRTVATPAEIPALVKLLDDPAVADWAREVLERIPGGESLEALRESLGRLQGKTLVGAINSLGARGDREAVPALIPLASNADAAVAAAAVRALGKIGGPAAVEALAALHRKATPETTATIAASYLRAAEGSEKAGAIYEQLSAAENPPAIRRAAMKGLLSLQTDRTDLVLKWLAGDDSDARQIAGDALGQLASPEQTKRLMEQLPQLLPAARAVVLQALAERGVAEVLPAAVGAAGDADMQLRLAGLETLAFVGQADQVPLLIDRLVDDNPLVATTAKDSLFRISAEGVDEAILAALPKTDDERSGILMELLARRRAAVAVPALLEQAGQPEPEHFAKALEALRSLGTSGEIPALVKLLLAAEKGARRDEIEKTIMLLSEQTGDPQGRAEPILATIQQLQPAERNVLLPLVGRIGGEKAHEAVEAALQSSQDEVREAGVRALCNWPDASVADELLGLAKDSPNRAHRVWALRAYIRVISLPSDRPDAETLAMLQQAMQLAGEDAEKKLVLSRASAVRTVETLRWVAPYLDNPALAQEASRAVVELAHHRFLMYPNRAEFVPALEKVLKVCKDQALMDRAKQYLQRQ